MAFGQNVFPFLYDLSYTVPKTIVRTESTLKRKTPKGLADIIKRNSQSPKVIFFFNAEKEVQVMRHSSNICYEWIFCRR